LLHEPPAGANAFRGECTFRSIACLEGWNHFLA
jgi:hypothetical protein